MVDGMRRLYLEHYDCLFASIDQKCVRDDTNIVWSIPLWIAVFPQCGAQISKKPLRLRARKSIQDFQDRPFMRLACHHHAS
jgi:hypothetical protein